MNRDRPQPRTQPRRIPQGAEALEGLHEHLLGDVLGPVEIPQPRQGDSEDRILIAVHDGRERFRAARNCIRE